MPALVHSLQLLGALPFALEGQGHSALQTLVAVASTAFLLLGIDHIAIEIEQPFDVLPLWQYAKLIERSIAQLEDGARAGGQLIS